MHGTSSLCARGFVSAKAMVSWEWSGAGHADRPRSRTRTRSCRGSKAAIRRQFAQLSPENKALIVRTQIERWINANRARLLPVQLQVMQEMAAVVSPDLYSPNRTGATLARVQELEKRAISLLGKEDVGRAATLEMAVYIPKSQ